MPAREWTAEQDALVRQLYEDRLTTAEMGLHFGINRSAVEKRIRFLQLPARPPIVRSRGAEWPEEKDARLTKLWANKELSTAEIGRQMGISKNAVVGRVRRLKLTHRPSPIRPGGSGSHPRAPRRPPVLKLATLESLWTPMLVPQAPVLAEPVGRIVPCSYPLGEVGTRSFRYCDEPSRPNSSYCLSHHQLCHIRTRQYEDVA